MNALLETWWSTRLGMHKPWCKGTAADMYACSRIERFWHRGWLPR